MVLTRPGASTSTQPLQQSQQSMQSSSGPSHVVPSHFTTIPRGSIRMSLDHLMGKLNKLKPITMDPNDIDTFQKIEIFVCLLINSGEPYVIRLQHKTITSKTMLQRIFFILDIILSSIETDTTFARNSIHYLLKTLFSQSKYVSQTISEISEILKKLPFHFRLSLESSSKYYGDALFQIDGIYRKADGLITSEMVKATDIALRESNCILVTEKRSVHEQVKQMITKGALKVILITGSGVPDLNARILLAKFSKLQGIRIFALTDCDPWGLKIFSIYRNGSERWEYFKDLLTTPEIIRIGLKMDQCKKYKIKMDEFNTEHQDIAKNLKKLFGANDPLRVELQEMEATKKIAALDKFVFWKNSMSS